MWSDHFLQARPGQGCEDGEVLKVTVLKDDQTAEMNHVTGLHRRLGSEGAKYSEGSDGPEDSVRSWGFGWAFKSAKQMAEQESESIQGGQHAETPRSEKAGHRVRASCLFDGAQLGRASPRGSPPS